MLMLAFCACMGALIYIEILKGYYKTRTETFVATIAFAIWSFANIILGFFFAIVQARFSELLILSRSGKLDLYERKDQPGSLFIRIH